MKIWNKAGVWAVALSVGVLFSGCAASGTKQSTGEAIDSAAITTKVKAALIDDSQVKALDINVDTFRGVVQLNGFVDNESQKTRAEQVAWGVSGVKSVKNNLSIKRSAPAQ